MIAAIILSVAALIVAIAGVRLAQGRIGELERRLETALAESAQQSEVGRSEAIERVEAWVHSEFAAERETAANTLSQWSEQAFGDIEALFESFRATVKADMAGMLGNALCELATSGQTDSASAAPSREAR